MSSAVAETWGPIRFTANMTRYTQNKINRAFRMKKIRCNLEVGLYVIVCVYVSAGLHVQL